MPAMLDGPHNIIIDDPDADGEIYIHCEGCEWNAHATDPVYVDSIALRHQVITGVKKLK